MQYISSNPDWLKPDSPRSNGHVMHFTRINASATTAGDKLRGALVPEILMANMLHNLDVR